MMTWFFYMRVLLVLPFILLSSAANAGTDARYQMGNGSEMRIEIADNGWARLSQDQSSYVIVSPDDKFYVIQFDAAGSYAMASDDLYAVLAEKFAAMMTQMGMKHPKESNGAAWPEEHYVSKGEEKVGVWIGTRYALEGKDDSEFIDIVVSPDPALDRLGKIFSASMLQSQKVMAGITGALPPMMAELPAILAKGSLIRFGKLAQLSSVTNADIALDRVSLPTRILSRQEIRDHQKP